MNKQTAQINMVKQQLRTGNIVDHRIIDLYQTVPRDYFVPHAYQDFAYSDMQIPLAHGQCMLTPLEEASLLQALDLQGHETVLEIGTGTGFFTTLLSRSARQVISVDCFQEFTQQAQKSCAHLGCENITFLTGDGSQGWVDKAPYDVMVLTGGIKALSETLKLQLLLGGKIFVILDKGPVMAGYLYQVDHHNHWTQRLIFETKVPVLQSRQFHQSFEF